MAGGRRTKGLTPVLPAWLAPRAPEYLPIASIRTPQLSKRSCMTAVVAQLRAAKGELRLAALVIATGYDGKEIGSCLAKLRASGKVKVTASPQGRRRGQGYRWIGGVE